MTQTQTQEVDNSILRVFNITKGQTKRQIEGNQVRVKQVQDGSQGQDRTDRKVRTGETRKQKLEKQGNMLIRPDITRLTGKIQTDNAGINTQGIMGKMGDTW
jgi:hypothetical protein